MFQKFFNTLTWKGISCQRNYNLYSSVPEIIPSTAFQHIPNFLDMSTFYCIAIFGIQTSGIRIISFLYVSFQKV
jgi:hypothetical protein